MARTAEMERWWTFIKPRVLQLIWIAYVNMGDISSILLSFPIYLIHFTLI
jgi:hypothetical protein